MSEKKTKVIRCARCRRYVDVPEDYQLLTCPQCLAERHERYENGKIIPTEAEVCRRFRQQYMDPRERGPDYALFYDSHVPYCEKCKKWLESRQTSGQDAYDTMFGRQPAGLGEGGGEDRKGWRSICPYCGSELKPDGSCPNRCSGDYG